MYKTLCSSLLMRDKYSQHKRYSFYFLPDNAKAAKMRGKFYIGGGFHSFSFMF
jgi:hypothetical protein